MLAALLDAKVRRAARSNLYDFARYTAPPEYDWGWHHETLYRWLDDFAHGRRKRLIIEMPPRHGKSEGTSRRLPAFMFGAFPSSHIILASHNASLAEDMSRDTREILETRRYRRVFPNAGLGVGTRDRDQVGVYDVRGGGSFRAAGIGTGISGRGFTHGIIDDYIADREQANSPTMREKIWRWYTSVFWKRQVKNAGIIITATRWHEDDLIGRIKRKMAAGESEPWDILTLPALATDKRHPEDPRKFGEALWPWFRTAEQWEVVKRIDPRDFYALDQQDPRTEGDAEWGSECFPSSIWFDDWPRADDISLLVIQLDPSKGKKSASGDYSAFIALARDRSGQLWVEADLARRPIARIVADGIEFARRIPGEIGKTLDGFGVESDGFQEMLADEFRRQSKEQGFTLPVKLITSENTNKEVRIRRLSGDITRKNIRFRNTPGTRLLVRQLEEFPNADHDDGPDALEQAKRLAVHCWNGKRK